MTRPGPVALILLRQAWRLRLQLAGFQDIENEDGSLRGPHFPGTQLYEPTPAEITKGDYYRRLAIESWRDPPLRHGPNRRRRYYTSFGRITPMNRSKAKDRKILFLLSSGTPIRKVMAQLHVGQGRVYRLLAKIHQRIARETRHGKETA